MDPVRNPLPAVKRNLLEMKASVPVQDLWRLPCLQKFLALKYEMEAKHQDTGELE